MILLTGHISGNLDSPPASVTKGFGQITAAPTAFLSLQTAPINNHFGSINLRGFRQNLYGRTQEFLC